MGKHTIRLNLEEFSKLAAENGLNNLTDIGAAIGVSSTQVWRTTLPQEDKRYNKPGTDLIAGTLIAFDVPFERLFFLDNDVRERTENVD